MSIARHHNEWLSLVPASGPFLSMPVLMRVFPQGLDGHESEHFRTLRLAYEEWSDRKTDSAIHKAWTKFVLGNPLELPDEVIDEGQAVMLQATIPAHGETLRPDYIIKNPADAENAGKPRLLVCTYPASQNLERPVAGQRWKASPDTRMMELLHRTNCRIGLVTNGEHWMLVNATGETTGYASWYTNLWLDENITLRAFRSLLGVRRFFSVPDEDTLEAMLVESADNQQEVTDQLGYQVRNAVDVLVRSLDRADQDRSGKLLKDISEEELYEAALTVMMRLVFLFSAEERELLPLDDPLYNQNYAVSTLRSALRETADQQTEDVLERRRDAWCRLLSNFRSVYGGIQHERLTLPAYGGHLLDPDRFPFLEGRDSDTKWRDTPATPLPINNRTVLHLLEALQILQVKVPGGGHAEARLLSFRALDIEQIGHVYEGLLDHTAKRAPETVLGFAGGKDKKPEIPLSKLEELRAKGEKELVDFLKKETGRTASPLKKALTEQCAIEHANRCKVACGSDELWKRVQPFAALVRIDTFGRPVIIRAGSVFVTSGTDRRSSGTHYTPTSLTEPIVRHTLDPLCFIGPAEGKPENEWKLRTARELLDLKICDMACGSGAFLVQTCRYLSELLVEAWEQAEKELPGKVRITPYGEPSEGAPSDQPIPSDTEERLVYARRVIAARCLYGVDVNPLAVEMAKLSLWLLTLAKDKPFEFLDHAFRCGDSLVGLHDLEQLRHYSLKPDSDDALLFKGPLDDAVDEAIDLRLRLEDMPANTIEDVEAQEKLLKEAEDRIARLRCAADLLVAGEFWGEKVKDKQERVRHAAVVSGHYVEKGPTEEFEQKAIKDRRGQKMFHWPLEFPEVIVKRGGFGAFVGNPPFMGGSKITASLGTPYRDFIVADIGHSARGKADLCAYFLLRASSLAGETGGFGLIATNSLTQGDARKVCLDRLVRDERTIYRAETNRSWPGTAGVTAAIVWTTNGQWEGECFLDDNRVVGISSYLEPDDALSGSPHRLAANRGRAFRGVEIKGSGFILDDTASEQLLRADKRNSEVIFPYIIGEDLCSRPDQSPDRKIINFREWSLEKASQYADCFDIVTRLVKPFRDGITKQIHEADYWKYWDKRLKSFETVSHLPRLLARSQVGNMHSVAFIPKEVVIDTTLIVFPISTFDGLAIIQSSIHEAWARLFAGAALRTDMRYSTKGCFETFPFPEKVPLESNKQHSALHCPGLTYHDYRSQVMLDRAEGLTRTYNRFHDSEETAADIQRLRDLHVEMDSAVAAAYGWGDLDLDHGFHETKQGVRFTISKTARREVLQRLLNLNHQRHDEEVKKTGSGKGRKKKVATGPALPGFDEDEEGG